MDSWSQKLQAIIEVATLMSYGGHASESLHLEIRRPHCRRDFRVNCTAGYRKRQNKLYCNSVLTDRPL